MSDKIPLKKIGEEKHGKKYLLLISEEYIDKYINYYAKGENDDIIYKVKVRDTQEPKMGEYDWFEVIE